MSWWLELFLTSEMCRAQILVLWDSIIVIVAAICRSALPGMALGCQSSQQPYRIEELLSLFFWWGNWGSRRKGMQKVVIVMWEGRSSLHCLPKWEGKRRCRRRWVGKPACVPLNHYFRSWCFWVATTSSGFWLIFKPLWTSAPHEWW